MKIEIKVPAMGESISEATIGQIIKPSGSFVAIDDEIIELETDKVNQVLYAPVQGVLTLVVTPQEVVKVGSVLGYIETEGVEAAPLTEKPEIHETTSKENAGSGVRYSAADFIGEFKNEPKGKEIPKPIIKAHQADRETRTKLTKIRKLIASRMVEAQQTAAMLTTFNEADLSNVMNLREKCQESFQKKHGVKLGFMSFFVKACVYALQEVPQMNCYIDGDEMVQRNYFDIGIAVGTDRGLVVPVLRNCDQLSIAEIEQQIGAFAEKARKGGLIVDDLQGGGFTITNGGVYGSLLSTPILNPPQSGILGMHKIEKRPVVVNDQIVIRPMMYLALSYDHRVIDGKEAVTFLVHVKNIIEDPGRLILEV